jgi:hypothetical protein
VLHRHVAEIFGTTLRKGENPREAGIMAKLASHGNPLRSSVKTPGRHGTDELRSVGYEKRVGGGSWEAWIRGDRRESLRGDERQEGQVRSRFVETWCESRPISPGSKPSKLRPAPLRWNRRNSKEGPARKRVRTWRRIKTLKAKSSGALPGRNKPGRNAEWSDGTGPPKA